MLQANVAGQLNYYDLLQVAPEAGQMEIRSAYRRLSRQYHPDRSTPAANERLQQEINAAWDVLSSPLARAQYDRQLALSQPRPRRTDKTKDAARTGAEAGQKPVAKQPERPPEKASRGPAGNSSPPPPDSSWRHSDGERLQWETERRRAEQARAREEQERRRREEEQARLMNDPCRAQYQRVMREREIRIAAERAGQQAGAPVRSEAGAQEAAEEARERLRVRRQQLFVSRG